MSRYPHVRPVEPPPPLYAEEDEPESLASLAIGAAILVAWFVLLLVVIPALMP